MMEIKLYKSRWKAIKLILLTLPFVLGGYFMGENNGDKALVWSCIIFFGLGLVIGLFDLLDNRPELVLNESGVFARMSYGIFDKAPDKGNIKWDVIKNAYVLVYFDGSFHGIIPLTKQRMICIELCDKEKKNPKYNTKVRKFSNALGGSDYNFSLVKLKVDAQKLAEIINSMSIADPLTRQQLLSTVKI